MRLQTAKREGRLALMCRHYQIYLLLLPTLTYFLLFKYAPMYGLQMAFRNYNTGLGIWNSAWVGLKYFERVLARPYFYQVLSNTLTISLTSLIVGFPLPVLFALMLNEMRGRLLEEDRADGHLCAALHLHRGGRRHGDDFHLAGLRHHQ